jgi:hypothetical protein
MSISKENFRRRLRNGNQFKHLHSLYKLTNENINMLFNENENRNKTITNILNESKNRRSETKLRLAKKQNPGMNHLHYLGNNRVGLRDITNFENQENNIKHNCFILGHGSTLKKKYIIVPDNIYLKFYTSKGNPLTGINTNSYITEYSNNPYINLSSAHYLHPDSVTHNMSIKLLSFFGYIRRAGELVLSDLPIQYSKFVGLIGHSGLIVGSKIKHFYQISEKTYKEMGIRLLVHPMGRIIIYDFGENIYGVSDLDQESLKDHILIVNNIPRGPNNTPDEENNPLYIKYIENIRITLEYYFVRKFGYPSYLKYTEEMENTVEE